MTRFACVFHVLRCPRHAEKRICSLCIYIISVRTHAGCSIAPDLMQMELVIREKDFRAKIHAVGGNSAPLGYYWREFSECTLTRFSRNRQKKKPLQ